MTTPDDARMFPSEITNDSDSEIVVHGVTVAPSMTVHVHGITIRAYAAIRLKVPDSGLDWLDEMILKSRREELAKAAMQGLLSNSRCRGSSEECALDGYALADAVLKEGEKKP